MSEVKDILPAMLRNIAAVKLDGYTAFAKPWQGKTRTRIYVTVRDVKGIRQPGELYLDIEKGAVEWAAKPAPLPVWAEALVLEMKLTYLELGLASLIEM